MSRVGLVVIGRNEGERLRQCLRSVLGKVALAVYVDSGSTDGSVEVARSLEVDVVELDLSTPFTAARARNAGFHYLLDTDPQIELVQFVDGDCEIAEAWLDQAQRQLSIRQDVAIVCGRRRERFPQSTIYNRLLDMEWDTPIGETKACGGDAMMRVVAFNQVGGFNPALVAGEEPELCVRLRQNGWTILRLDAEMTLHDGQMIQFNQWWKRATRAGHAYAEGAWLHGRGSEGHWARESLSIWSWGLLLPLLALGAAWSTQGLSLLLVVAYPLQIYRIYNSKRQDTAPKDAMLYALFCVLSKFPQLQGQTKFHLERLTNQRSRLIEYKTAANVEVD